MFVYLTMSEKECMIWRPRSLSLKTREQKPKKKLILNVLSMPKPKRLPKMIIDKVS